MRSLLIALAVSTASPVLASQEFAQNPSDTFVAQTCGEDMPRFIREQTAEDGMLAAAAAILERERANLSATDLEDRVTELRELRAGAEERQGLLTELRSFCEGEGVCLPRHRGERRRDPDLGFGCRPRSHEAASTREGAGGLCVTYALTKQANKALYIRSAMYRYQDGPDATKKGKNMSKMLTVAVVAAFMASATPAAPATLAAPVGVWSDWVSIPRAPIREDESRLNCKMDEIGLLCEPDALDHLQPLTEQQIRDAERCLALTPALLDLDERKIELDLRRLSATEEEPGLITQALYSVFGVPARVEIERRLSILDETLEDLRILNDEVPLMMEAARVCH